MNLSPNYRSHWSVAHSIGLQRTDGNPLTCTCSKCRRLRIVHKTLHSAEVVGPFSFYVWLTRTTQSILALLLFMLSRIFSLWSIHITCICFLRNLQHHHHHHHRMCICRSMPKTFKDEHKHKLYERIMTEKDDDDTSLSCISTARSKCNLWCGSRVLSLPNQANNCVHRSATIQPVQHLVLLSFYAKPYRCVWVSCSVVGILPSAEITMSKEKTEEEQKKYESDSK